MMKRFTILAFVAVALTTPALLAGDPAAGKALYAICATCHGQNGEGMKAVNGPAIAGQEEWYLVRQLKNFKAGVRGADPKDVFGMQMRPMAMTLANDKAIEDVAAYISSLTPIKPKDTLGGNAAKGKALFTICSTCHGPKGEGMQAMGGPKVYIQQDWYLERQLKNFKAGIRGTNPKDTFGMQMRPMAMTLADDQAIKDVIAYMLTLH